MVRLAEDPQVADLVRRLRCAIDPCTIWLFDSRAQGNPRHDSDSDVMVVVPESDENHFARSARAEHTLDGFRGPTDVIVYTREEWDHRGRYSIASEVAANGVVIHGE